MLRRWKRAGRPVASEGGRPLLHIMGDRWAPARASCRASLPARLAPWTLLSMAARCTLLDCAQNVARWSRRCAARWRTLGRECAAREKFMVAPPPAGRRSDDAPAMS
ncbi:hypothetical protein F511_41383 [Dorcoceras hygrometricum]|uniref:Uncharacterized protein n=1 Tax=Dorcoceras hygrometricum TaxID=472368 RepID=A0A2Z7C7Y0_9LAMI|nr:hypothetical protein F511_41383 [Dorcoceras hygrometricum]